MDLPLPLQGLLIGFSIAAPVGPIGLLCIQLTLNQGRKYGIAAGLGAATADAFYGLVAGLGLTFISGFLLDQQEWLRLFGGLFLCYLGVKTFRTEPARETAVNQSKGIFSVYLTVLALTLTNPITILAFTAIFAGLGLGSRDLSIVQTALFVFTVFCGSALWWLLLTTLISLVRNRFQPRHLQWINWGAGLIIVAFGLVAIGTWTNTIFSR
ncbi:MAG: LysE family translocator [Anaerolineales bacterium]|nr:LysE family translocator [Anaerolineales bacterium]